MRVWPGNQAHVIQVQPPIPLLDRHRLNDHAPLADAVVTDELCPGRFVRTASRARAVAEVQTELALGALQVGRLITPRREV